MWVGNFFVGLFCLGEFLLKIEDFLVELLAFFFLFGECGGGFFEVFFLGFEFYLVSFCGVGLWEGDLFGIEGDSGVVFGAFS